LNVDAGVIVTGSHNPACDNGFKMTLKDRPLTGDDLKQIVQHTSCLSLIPSLKINGIYTMLDLEDQYCARIMQDYEKPSKDKKLGKRLKVVFDPGNGATCLILKKLVKQLDIDYHILNGEIDGTFPVHDPDPTLTKNLTGLIDSVLELKADLGIAFDGDGDRIGVVDDTGYHFEGDQLMVLWVRDILKNSNSKNRKLKIVGDIKSSLILSEEVENLNAEFILCRTGHSFIKKKIKETGAIFAGEMSGHIFFNDHYFGFDDAPYAMIRLISLFNRPFHQKLSTIRKTFRKTWGTPEKFSIIENIKEKVISDGLSFLDMDGIRVDYEDGWWLIRASNTQALLIGRVEGRTLQAKERLELEFQKYVMDFSDNP
jgi:phosphomannomutase